MMNENADSGSDDDDQGETTESECEDLVKCYFEL